MREDWKLVRDWLHTQQGLSRVLDVGCYDGRLLESLGPDYALLGVELHPGARVRAEARGVQILVDNFTDLSQIKAVADVTIACDVIEHSADPRTFLEGLATTVRPGGYVLVTTGNTDAWTWRLMGSRYWYCFIAEHISFINPAWVRKNKDSLGLELQQVVHFSHTHSGASLSSKVYELLANFLLRFVPKLFAFIRRRGFGGIDVKNHPNLELSSPSWMTATDHMFLVFRKKNSG
jgi:SAM-dependent methyltransferase